MIARDTLSLRHFPLVVSSECRNLRRIYPLKQRQVAEIYEESKKHPIVRKIIVFGSAVTPNCRVDSDLDLCIDADISDGRKVYELQKQVGSICGWNCDILIYSQLGSRLKSTIDREGVVIYEQSAGKSQGGCGDQPNPSYG